VLHVGLTGGLASGKGVIADELTKLGCRVIHMDELGHQVLGPGGEACADVVTAFGPSILNADGSLNRRLLASQVFADPERLAVLNALVHPPIQARARALREDWAKIHPHGIAVTEAAILIETGGFRACDRLIVACCRPEQQVERAMARDAITREDALQRMRRQMPIEEKIKYADFRIDTSDTLESTRAQTRAVFEQLQDLT
jgi:dephospho-CoA kinase